MPVVRSVSALLAMRVQKGEPVLSCKAFAAFCALVSLGFGLGPRFFGGVAVGYLLRGAYKMSNGPPMLRGLPSGQVSTKRLIVTLQPSLQAGLLQHATAH